MAKIAVIAVGGNALVLDNRHTSFEDQRAAMEGAAQQIVQLLTEGWSLAVVHGNGPQVGFAMQRSELARPSVEPIPMDAAVAETQGTLGYALQQVIGNAVNRANLNTQVVTLLTQVVVEQDDPAFRNPTKPVGGFLDEATARQRADQDGWQVMEDAGRGWRRVVASPRPLQIIELPVIQQLLRSGQVCVICGGGGGIPVVQTSEGLRGVAAVIDKDLTSSLLARSIGAELLLICTGVTRVSLNFGTPQQEELAQLGASQARKHLLEGHFKAGSMKPKIDAGLSFLEATGGRIVITDVSHIAAGVSGQAGTQILPD